MQTKEKCLTDGFSTCKIKAVIFFLGKLKYLSKRYLIKRKKTLIKGVDFRYIFIITETEKHKEFS